MSQHADEQRLDEEPLDETTPDETEYDPERDDPKVGRYLKGSLAVMVTAAAIVTAVLVWMNARQPTAVSASTAVVAPQVRAAATVEIPRVTFTDITREAGIGFVHVNGAYGEKLLPETMGGGCAFFDFDNDHDQDLLLVTSGRWPWRDEPAASEPAPKVALYRNDGTGHFENVTAGCGLDLAGYGMGVAVGDYDADGLVDVFLTSVGPNRLYRNLGGGRFADVTAEAGVAGEEHRWSTGCGFFDYDRDGDLDLFVCNYVEWSRGIDLGQAFALTGIGRAYGPPLYFAGTLPYLYRNEGGGRFQDVSAAAGVQVRNSVTGVPLGKSLGLRIVDLDRDGWLDVIVANDTVQNFVFHNQEDGTFREIGIASGMAFDSDGNARGAMGIDAGWYRNNRQLGVAIGNFATEMMALYVSQGEGLLFTDEAIAAGLGPPTRLELSFGVLFFDYDLDGRLDVLSANGHVEDEINKVQASQHYRQPAHLFWNAGPEHPNEFLEVSVHRCGPDLMQPIVGRGSSYADIDADGDQDVLITQIAGPPLLLRNNADRHTHYLRFKLRGARGNSDAIGAVVEAEVDGQTLRREVMPTRGYLSQVELPVTIGLGPRRHVDKVTVRWPDGAFQSVDDNQIDALTIIRQSP
jgi:hypothetical protein